MLTDNITNFFDRLLPYGDNKNIETVTGLQHFNRKFIKLIIVAAINIIIMLNISSLPIVVKFRIIAINIIVFCLLDIILPSIGDINKNNTNKINRYKLLRGTIRILMKIMIICNINILLLNNFNLVKSYMLVIIPNVITFILLSSLIPSIKRNSLITSLDIWCDDPNNHIYLKDTSREGCIRFLESIGKQISKDRVATQICTINKNFNKGPNGCFKFIKEVIALLKPK